MNVCRNLAVSLMFGLVIVCPAARASAQTAPLASFEQGTFLGKTVGSVRTFFGVPFADAPIGALRWRPPNPASFAKGVRDATQFGSDCMQPPSILTRMSKAPRTSEDCLTLNIWAPVESQSERLPVMVWIYGGSFLGGSASAFDGSALAQKGVIVVAANYRTGLFGFLAHPLLTQESKERTSGDYGLLDQIAALHWVQENIARIGGDPKSVTLFGESSGASSVSLLLTSPLAKGLFSKAILESPGAMRPLATLKDAEAAGSVVGSDLAVMRAMPAEDLLALATRLVPAERSLTRPRVIGPIVDGRVVPTEERPAYGSGAVAHVPIIIGGNADEGRLFVGLWPIKTVAQFQTYVGDNFGANAAQILRLYPASQDSEVPARLSELFADTQFNLGYDGVADAMASLGLPVYRYRFTHVVRGMPPTHGGELAFVFGLASAPKVSTHSGPPSSASSDERISDAMMNAWTQFARSGDPSGAGLAWPRYTPTSKAYLEFGEEPEAKSLPSAPRLQYLNCLRAGLEPCSLQ
jgi:carboxylesterase type B